MSKRVRWAVCVVWICTAASCPAGTRSPAVTWEDLPLIRTGVKTRSYSSYNPTGRTYRDFMNYTRVAGGEYELALDYGSGMLVQMWSTGIGNIFGTGEVGDVLLYLSSRATPDYREPWDSYFVNDVPAHPQPLWGKFHVARWGFPCLGFSDRFRATCTDTPHWYQFTCHFYREPRFSETLTPEQLTAWNAKVAASPGSFPGRDRGNRRSRRSITVAPAAKEQIFARNGAGVVRSMRLKTSDVSSEVLDNLWVEIRVDAPAEPAVYVPASVFFGGYVKSPMDRARGLPCGYDGQWLYFYFPMPFWRSMRVRLENRSPHDVTVSYDLGWSNSNPYPAEGAGVFRMQYNDGILVKAGQGDFAHLHIRGSGHIVGTSANLAGSIEGNFRTYIDGNKTPAIETTGGEDYFCHAFGIRVQLQTPFHGGLNDKIGYRFHIADYVPFLNEISFGQDHAHNFTHDCDGTFRSAVFYYWNPEPVLVRTDHLDVGDVDSEKEHGYKVAGDRVRLQCETACYEGNHTEPIVDAGRWTDGESTFRVQIDPDNDGVRLRKRINHLVYHQSVDVFVDGKPAGVWFEQGSQYHLFQEKKESRDYQPAGYRPDWNAIDKRFRDTEFEIPASLTAGKSAITLRLKTRGSLAALEPADAGLTNEYQYWVYSYRKTVSD